MVPRDDWHVLLYNLPILLRSCRGLSVKLFLLSFLHFQTLQVFELVVSRFHFERRVIEAHVQHVDEILQRFRQLHQPRASRGQLTHLSPSQQFKVLRLQTRVSRDFTSCRKHPVHPWIRTHRPGRILRFQRQRLLNLRHESDVFNLLLWPAADRLRLL